MKIRLITVSKEDNEHTSAIFQDYADRLAHYASFESLNIKPVKAANPQEQKKSDALQLLKKIPKEEFLVLLDEHGKEMTSVQFANFISQKMTEGIRSLSFVIGGAHGVDKSIHDRGNTAISLSKFTLPHQLAKVIFAEQLYRAFTIIRNEKYHH